MFDLKDKNTILLFDYIYEHRSNPCVRGMLGITKDSLTNLSTKTLSVLKQICGIRELNIIMELLQGLSYEYYNDTSLWRQIPVYGTMFTEYMSGINYNIRYEIFLLPPNVYDLCTAGWDMYDILYNIEYFSQMHTLIHATLYNSKTVEHDVWKKLNRFNRQCQKSLNEYGSIYALTSSSIMRLEYHRMTEKGSRVAFFEDRKFLDSFDYWLDTDINIMNAHTGILSVNDAIDILTDFLSSLKNNKKTGR